MPGSRGPLPAFQHQRPERDPDWTYLPVEGYQGEIPELPSTYRFEVGGELRTRTYLAETRAWFEGWARSPQATQFAESDWRQLLSTARLYDRYVRTASHTMLGRIRGVEAGWGATEADRRRLRWRIATKDPTTQAEAAEHVEEHEPGVAPGGGGSRGRPDPRRSHLTAVPDGGGEGG